MMGRGLTPALCALSILVTGCHRPAPDPSDPLPPGTARLDDAQLRDLRVVIEPVARREIGREVVTSGRVTFHDLHVAHIFSPVTGRVVRIEAELGQKVKKGDRLATIESPDVGQAFADLAKAQADSIAAEHEFKRQREMSQAHAASQRDLEQSQDSYRKAQAELERARRKARLFRAGKVDMVSQTYTLTSPIDGQVIARNLNPGVEVQGQYSGGNSVELFTVGDLDSVWVMADLFEMDLPRIRVGAPVTVRVVGYPQRTFTGRVDWIAGVLDPATRSAKVRCIIPNPRRELRPEMFATVSITVSGHLALAIPRNALLRLGDQTVVFVASGRDAAGRAVFERRAVAVDEEGGGEFLPVTHGLAPGDRVVVSGAIFLSGKI